MYTNNIQFDGSDSNTRRACTYLLLFYFYTKYTIYKSSLFALSCYKLQWCVGARP